MVELTSEELGELLSGSEQTDDKLPPFLMELEDYDLDEFKRGLKETSYLAGKITAILNAGFSEASALDLILSMETVKHNIKVAEINRETSVEVSKNAKLSQEKYEL
jgi:hypothetical protein